MQNLQILNSEWRWAEVWEGCERDALGRYFPDLAMLIVYGEDFLGMNEIKRA